MFTIAQQSKNATKTGAQVVKAAWYLDAALARLAVLETTIGKLDLEDTTLRDGLRLAVADIVGDVDTARTLARKA